MPKTVEKPHPELITLDKVSLDRHSVIVAFAWVLKTAVETTQRSLNEGYLRCAIETSSASCRDGNVRAMVEVGDRYSGFLVCHDSFLEKKGRMARLNSIKKGPICFLVYRLSF